MTDDMARLVCLLTGVVIGGAGMWLLLARRVTDLETRLRTVTRLRPADKTRAEQLIQRGLRAVR